MGGMGYRDGRTRKRGCRGMCELGREQEQRRVVVDVKEMRFVRKCASPSGAAALRVRTRAAGSTTRSLSLGGIVSRRALRLSLAFDPTEHVLRFMSDPSGQEDEVLSSGRPLVDQAQGLVVAVARVTPALEVQEDLDVFQSRDVFIGPFQPRSELDKGLSRRAKREFNLGLVRRRELREEHFGEKVAPAPVHLVRPAV